MWCTINYLAACCGTREKVSGTARDGENDDILQEKRHLGGVGSCASFSLRYVSHGRRGGTEPTTVQCIKA